MEDEDARPLLVLMHGNRTVSHQEPGAADRRQVGASPASPRWPTATAATWSAAPRRSAPASAMPVYVERSVLALPRIAINGGRRGYLVGIDAAGAASSCWRRSRCTARWQKSRLGGDALALPRCIAAYLIGSLSFAVIVSRADGARRSAQLRLAATRARPTCCARATRPPRCSRCCSTRSRAWCRCCWCAPFGAHFGLGEGTRRAGRAGGLPRPPVAGVLRLQGRQGRGHGGRRAARR